MIIHSITLDNVKSIEHLELKDIPDNGVFRISGENERGKSTIMDALNILFTCRCKSGKEFLKKFKSKGKDEPPTVGASMTVGDYRMHIIKRFAKRGGRCELIIDTPHIEKLTGERAEKRFDEIIADNVDSGLREVLFLRQDGDKNKIDASGIPPLEHALQNGSDSSGDSEILALAVNELNKTYTAKNRDVSTKSELGKAKKRLEECQQKVLGATEKRDALEDKFRALRKAEDDRRRIEQIKLPEAKEELDRAEHKLKEAVDLRRHVDEAKNNAEIVAKDFVHAENDVKGRSKLYEDVAQRQKDVDQAKTDREEAARNVQRAQNEYQKIQKILDEAEKAVEEARVVEQEAYKSLETAEEVEAQALVDLELVEKFDKRNAQRQRLEKLGDLEGRVAAARSTQPELAVTREQFDQIESAKKELDFLRKTLQQNPASLIFTGSGVIEIDGEEITLTGEPKKRKLVNGTVLRIGDVEAVYASGTEGPSRRDVTCAQGRLDKLVADTGAADLEAARTAREATARSEKLIEDACRNLEDEQRRVGTAADIERDIKDLDAALQGKKIPVSSRLEVEKALDEAKVAVQKAKEERRATEKKRTETEETKKNAEKQLKQADPESLEKELTAAETKLAGAEKEYKAACDRLQEAEAERGEAELKTAYNLALLKKDEAEKIRDDLAAQFAELNEAKLTSALQDAKIKVARLEDALKQVSEDVTRFEGYMSGKGSVAGEVQDAEYEKERARREYERLRRKAEGIKLLVETLERKQKEAREHYAPSYKNKLEKYAQPIFGGEVQFDLDEKTMGIKARVLNGTEIELEGLSSGAQEQVDIITRLAIAEIAGCRIPVFLDDALGSTDAERLKSMGKLLAETGKNTQVFVLTCEPERFDSVSGIIDYRMDDIAPRAKE